MKKIFTDRVIVFDSVLEFEERKKNSVKLLNLQLDNL